MLGIMSTMDTPMAPQPMPVHKNSPLPLITAVVGALAIIILGIWYFMPAKQAPQAFRLIEGGVVHWYWLDKDTVTPLTDAEAAKQPVAPTLSGSFSGARAENGSVVAISETEGLIAVDAAGKKTVLIAGPHYSSGHSAVMQDAGAAVLLNSATDALDVFSLDSVRPTVLSYEGSVKQPAAPAYMTAVGFAARDTVVMRTNDGFEVYKVKDGAVSKVTTAHLASEKSAFLQNFIPVAYAYSYPTPPTATGASTGAPQKCSGATVATLSGSNGTVADGVPSDSYLIWSGISNAANLPANYSNPGSYCIDGKITTSNTVWSAVYVVHSGNGTTATGATGTGGTQTNPQNFTYYVLTYTATPSVSFNASPTTLDQGSATALTWSTSNVTSCTGTGFSTGSATSGSVAASPATTTTYGISCTGSNGTVSASTTVTVLHRANLTSGTVTPSSGVTGSPVTFSSTISNTGVVSAASSTVFFSATDSGNSVVGTASSNVGPIAASGTTVSTGAITFSSAGTYSVRACADYTSAVTESNESDNCSGATTVTVTAGGSQPTAAFSLSTSSITLGGSATATWSSSNASLCTGMGFTTSGATSGTATVAPTTTTQFGVICDPTSGGSGSGSWTVGEWWSGGTSNSFYGEFVHDNGHQDDLCATNAALNGYTDWNETFTRYPNRCDDTGCDVAYVQCYAITGKTGTVSKPSTYNQGNCTSPTEWGCQDISYRHSTSGGTGFTSVTKTATLTVTDNGQCGDGVDNDGDGLLDSSDPSCLSCTGSSCVEAPPNGTVSCGVSNSAPALGATVTYTASGGSAPYTWTPSNASMCTAGTSATHTCVFTVAGPYTMGVSAAAGSGTCPAVTAGTPTAYIMATPDRVNAGGSSTLSFSAAQISASAACTVTGPNGIVWSGTASAGVLATTTASATNITKQSTFTISCDSGAATHSVVVNIVPKFEEF